MVCRMAAQTVVALGFQNQNRILEANLRSINACPRISYTMADQLSTISQLRVEDAAWTLNMLLNR